MALPDRARVEQYRRSIAMLPPGAPALDREKALELYEQLLEALAEVPGPSSAAGGTLRGHGGGGD